MVKFGSSDVIAILREFAIAADDNMPRQVEQLATISLSESSTLLTFRFLGVRYHLLMDSAAEDSERYIFEQIQPADRTVEGQLVPNPRDSLMTYGLPYKGKELYLVRETTGKQRLDAWLATEYPDISRSTWQKHLKNGVVMVNGTVETSAKRAITPHDTVEVTLPEKADHNDATLPIIHLDDNVIVVDKPAGVLTHAKGELNDEFTVADFFRRYTTVGLDTNRPGIIHRLDRDTSGVIIGARNPETATLLQRQFAQRKVKKTYQAIVDGQPQPAHAKIDLPIGRNPAHPSQFRVDSKGKSARTTYEVTETDGVHSLVTLQPETGRTHQLRVHLAYIGTPITGDRVYGHESSRMYLHAHQLEITIPEGDRRVFTSPIPSTFRLADVVE